MFKNLIEKVFGPNFSLPSGTSFFLHEFVPDEMLLRTLQEATRFLNSVAVDQNLYQFDDWLEHDGLHFYKRRLKFPDLERIVSNQGALTRSMPGDFAVRIGLAPTDQSWYFRFYVDEKNEGDFGLTLPPSIASSIRPILAEVHGDNLGEQDANSYFERITDDS